MVKPFSPTDHAARIRAALRRGAAAKQLRRKLGDDAGNPTYILNEPLSAIGAGGSKRGTGNAATGLVFAKASQRL